MFDWHSFPWSNFHGVNFNWILQRVKELFQANEDNERNITGLREWITRVSEYVHNYFAGLNVAQAVRERLESMAADGTLSEVFNFRFFTGFNRAWNIFRVGDMVQQTGKFSTTPTGAEQSESGIWVGPITYRPLDMPLETGASVVGGVNTAGAWPVNMAVINHRLRYRVQARENPNNTELQVSFVITGKHAIPPARPQYNANANGQQAVAIAKSYYDARVDGRKFTYGRNFTYAGRSELNDSTGGGLMECDTLVAMTMMGIPYNRSPYANTAENATYDFNALTPGGYSWVLPWKDYDDYGGRVTTTSAENWYFWHNANVFTNRSALADGDIVIFTSPTANFFDGIIHIGIVSMENDEPWIYHVSKYVTPTEEAQPVVRHDRLDDLIASGYYGDSTPYYARPDYGA